MRSVAETLGSIQVSVDHHLAARQRRSPAHPLDLQTQILKLTVLSRFHAALKLQREIRSKSRLRQGTNAFPRCAGAL